MRLSRTPGWAASFAVLSLAGARAGNPVTPERVALGRKLYFDERLGGTIGISCDMCHPDGRNTHPESCPKYQAQTKKVALLRDMINWCIENPLKGKPLPEDDPRLRAVEAYILSTRKGVALVPGKH